MQKHVSPDISNEISGVAISMKRSNFKGYFFQVHHPNYLIFWDRRINVMKAKVTKFSQDSRFDKSVNMPQIISRGDIGICLFEMDHLHVPSINCARRFAKLQSDLAASEARCAALEQELAEAPIPPPPLPTVKRALSRPYQRRLYRENVF